VAGVQQAGPWQVGAMPRRPKKRFANGVLQMLGCLPRG
jgi:hypothetical protein